MPNILGVSAFFHDSGACLVQDGEIIAAAQEERFTRKKHDDSFPVNAIQYCLEEAQIEAGEIDYVVFYEKPLLKFERLLETYLSFAPRGFLSFRKAIPVWLKKKLFMERELRMGPLKNYHGPLVFPEHHESHAASAFFPSPFESAAILTIDGVGEWATTTIAKGSGNSIEIVKQLNFPHSLGLLYSAFTYFLGFKVNSGEYKLMGLAPYGQPKYSQLIWEHLIHLNDDGSFRLNLEYFDYPVGLKMTNRKFADLFGCSVRRSESEIEQIHMDLAASIQNVLEEVVLKIAHHAYEVTGEKKVCLAGGVALNCVSNGVLARNGPFDEIWVQPASGDAGGSLGSALFCWHQLLGNSRQLSRLDSQKGSLLGPSFSNYEIRNLLQKKGAIFKEYGDEIEQASDIAELIKQQCVVGLHHGRMEFGPRALGSRSILGDPRSPEMQKVMNLKIKFRESFRPFAPSILKSHMHAYFMTGNVSESPYMLMVAPVKAEHRLSCEAELDEVEGLEKLLIPRSKIPAVTHVDFSARVQSVDPERSPFYCRIIEAFYEKTGCPMLINTSFNIRGEPIVCTPGDAFRCFMGTHMDVLVVGAFVLIKSEQPKGLKEEFVSYLEEFELD